MGRSTEETTICLHILHMYILSVSLCVIQTIFLEVLTSLYLPLWSTALLYKDKSAEPIIPMLHSAFLPSPLPYFLPSLLISFYPLVSTPPPFYHLLCPHSFSLLCSPSLCCAPKTVKVISPSAGLVSGHLSFINARI